MPLKFDRVSSRFVAKSDPSKLPKKVPIPKNVPPPSASAASASVLGDRALLKEATTRITHDGGENPLMIGISPLPSFPPSLSLVRENGGSCFGVRRRRRRRRGGIPRLCHLDRFRRRRRRKRIEALNLPTNSGRTCKQAKQHPTG